MQNAELLAISLMDGSPQGGMLYYCCAKDAIHAQRLQPVTKRPIGKAVAVYQFPSLLAGRPYARLTVAANRIVFDSTDWMGNI